jgi:hypothetical protein
VTRTARLVGPAVLCLLLALALSQFSTRQERLLPPPPPAGVPSELAASLVQPRDVARYAPGTPQRAFLTWWRAAQYDDVAEAHAGLASPLQRRYPVAQLVTELRFAAGGFTGLLPRIAGTTPGARDQVALQVDLVGFAKGRPSAIVPQTFHLRREAAGWRVSDVGYMTIKAAEGRAAAAGAR